MATAIAKTLQINYSLAETFWVLPSNTTAKPLLLPDLSRSISRIIGARVAPFSPVGCRTQDHEIEVIEL